MVSVSNMLLIVPFNAIPATSKSSVIIFCKGYDGNVYGLVLNVNGVVINDFIETRPAEAIGNQNIYLQNITISNIISRPVEIIALNSISDEGGAYGGKRQVGPIGDILDIKSITKNEKYKSDLLSDAQLIIAKAKIDNNDSHFGTTNITENIVKWSNDNTNLNDVMNNHDYYFVKGGDSMGHTMKGNIGLFISAGENIRVNGLYINNVISHGNQVSIDEEGNCKGGDSNGIVITGSRNIILNSSVINHITTENKNATAKKIKIIESTNIVNN